MPSYKETKYSHDDYDEMSPREILKGKNYPLAIMGLPGSKGGNQIEISSLLSNGKVRSKKTHLGDHFISHNFFKNFTSLHKNMDFEAMEFYEISINDLPNQ